MEARGRSCEARGRIPCFLLFWWKHGDVSRASFFALVVSMGERWDVPCASFFYFVRRTGTYPVLPSLVRSTHLLQEQKIKRMK